MGHGKLVLKTASQEGPPLTSTNAERFPHPSAAHTRGPLSGALAPLATPKSFVLQSSIPDKPPGLGSFIIPLPVDQRLLTLVQYNVKRAILANNAILGLLDMPHNADCRDFTRLPFQIPPPRSIPPSLQPTAIELSVPHNPIYAAIPFPVIRDNLILLEGQFDFGALARDMYGGLFEGFDDIEPQAVMVWGEPWSPEAWEVSEAFLKKWGFVLRGCADLIDGTNRWREIRGEERLVIEL
ncbi:hypothetical protein GQ53DRAFT_708103 [Thozetella sp. PMI_491]|nr:hypothetical protein GQ53DRAFT_708103 [Thozetella sp. PMI_491]